MLIMTQIEVGPHSEKINKKQEISLHMRVVTL